MQLLENTPMGLRAARLTLTSLSKPQIELFPMVHVGEADFYRQVYDEAFACDVVLVEGVKSPITHRVTRSYRWITASKKLRLIVQPPYPTQEASHAKIVHADLSASEFAVAWRKIPFWLRAMVYLMAPIVGLKHRMFASREALATGMGLEDVVGRDEALNWSPENGYINNAILHARDERLVELLCAEIESEGLTSRRIAIVYGASHMRAVVRTLSKRFGYFAEESAWMTVFSWEAVPLDPIKDWDPVI